MVKKLDKSKPYGEIVGGGQARYEQGGLKFDHLGDEVKVAAVVVAEPLMGEEALRAEVTKLQAELAKVKVDPKSKAAREAHEAELKKLAGELEQAVAERDQARGQLAEMLAGQTPAEVVAEQPSLLDAQLQAQAQVTG